jgi:hypothetical protein
MEREGIMLSSMTLFMSVGLLLADDSFPSGPQVGQKLTGFKALAFSGTDAGKEIELLKEGGKQPTLLIFVHRITRPALKVLRPVDKLAAELTAEKLHAQVVWLDELKTAKEYLDRAKNSLNLQTPIAISLDSKDGPPAYGLNDKVTLTILIARDSKVLANFALVDPNDADAPKILRVIEKVAGK